MEGNGSRKTTIFKSPDKQESPPLEIRIAAFAVVEGGSYHIRRHIHPEYEIMIPQTGSYRSRLNGKMLEVRPGEFLLIQAGDDHEDLCEGDFRFSALRGLLGGCQQSVRRLSIITRDKNCRRMVRAHTDLRLYCLSKSGDIRSCGRRKCTNIFPHGKLRLYLGRSI